MLSAPALQSNSNRTSTHPHKLPHVPFTASPLPLSSTPDVVTNPDRTKPIDIQRVLSPLRARRTPTLVNAPDVSWRLAAPPDLRCVPSFDSIVSGGTASSGSGSENGLVNGVETATSETGSSASASTVRPYQCVQWDGLLVAESASSSSKSSASGSERSTMTVVPGVKALDVDVPLPSSLPASQQTHVPRDEDGGGGTRLGAEIARTESDERYMYVYRSHPLPPVLEASPSPASSVQSENVLVPESNGTQTNDYHNLQSNDHRSSAYVQREQTTGEAAAAAAAEAHTAHLQTDQTQRYNATAYPNGPVAQTLDDQDTEGKSSPLQRRLARIKNGIKRLGNRVAERVVRKLVARALVHVL